MRKPVHAYGCILEDGTKITTDDPHIVAIKVNPDKSVMLIDENNETRVLRTPWVSYTPRFN